MDQVTGSEQASTTSRPRSPAEKHWYQWFGGQRQASSTPPPPPPPTLTTGGTSSRKVTTVAQLDVPPLPSLTVSVSTALALQADALSASRASTGGMARGPSPAPSDPAAGTTLTSGLSLVHD